MNELLAVNDVSPSGQISVVAEPQTMMQVIARAAADPAVDMDKMERILAMHERMLDREAAQQFSAALAACQQAMPSVAERGEGHNKAKYARFEDINDVAKPHLFANGLAISFNVQQGEKGIEVTGILTHKGGHKQESSMVFPADTSGSKNAVQAIGSSVSYAKRYLMSAMLNITTRGEDDDGYAAVPFTSLSDTQREQVGGLFERLNPENQQKIFLTFGEVADIDKGAFDKCHAAMTGYLRQQGKANANT